MAKVRSLEVTLKDTRATVVPEEAENSKPRRNVWEPGPNAGAQKFGGEG